MDPRIIAAIIGGIAVIIAAIISGLMRKRGRKEVTPLGITYVTVNYYDGLPQISDKRRKDAFDKALSSMEEGRYKEAIAHLESCFEPGINASERVALHVLVGNCFTILGELEVAKGHYLEAEIEAEKVKDSEGLAASLGNVSLAHLVKGDFDQALDYCSRSLSLAEEANFTEVRVMDMCYLGLIYWYKGDEESAANFMGKALESSKEARYRLGQAVTLSNLGLFRLAKGRHGEALNLSLEAVEIAKDTGYRYLEADTLSNLGIVYYERGEYDKVSRVCEQALTTTLDIGYRLGEGFLSYILGLTYKRQGRPAESSKLLQEAQDIFRRIGAVWLEQLVTAEMVS